MNRTTWSYKAKDGSKQVAGFVKHFEDLVVVTVKVSGIRDSKWGQLLPGKVQINFYHKIMLSCMYYLDTQTCFNEPHLNVMNISLAVNWQTNV